MHCTWTYCSKLFAVAHLQWRSTIYFHLKRNGKANISEGIQTFPLNIWSSVRTRISSLQFYCLPLTNSIYSGNVFEEGWLNWQKLETLLNRRCKHWGATYKNLFRMMNCTHVSALSKQGYYSHLPPWKRLAKIHKFTFSVQAEGCCGFFAFVWFLFKLRN